MTDAELPGPGSPPLSPPPLPKTGESPETGESGRNGPVLGDSPVLGAAEARIPDDLRAAFDAYEAAIFADDVDVLDASFAPGPETLRGDGAGLLVGHDAISAFRARRGGVAVRVIDSIHYRPLADDTALLVATSRYAGGGRGLQTQVWQLIEGRWLIVAAHVTPRPAALDRTVWRSVGDPFFQGSWDGPLAGLTVAVKDLFAIKGFRIGAGNPAYLEGARPETTTAPAVADLLRGGASLRGIARTDEFAYSISGDNAHYGTPPNGAVPGALPGGSSSGPASAVATGQAEMGLATDTAGSIRVPASYQGLWGLRTTHGLVPRQGVLPLAQSFDTVGWLTRDGDTMQRIADWCLSYDGSDSTENVFGAAVRDLPWRFVVPAELLASADEPTRAAFEALLARVGMVDAADIGEASIGDPAEFASVFRTVQGAEAWRNHGEWLRAHPGAVGPAIAARFEAASTVTAADEAEARRILTRLSDALAGHVEHAVLLFPTAPGPAPLVSAPAAEIDRVRAATLRMTTPASVAGLPAVSVPLLTAPGPTGPAPVGVSLVSARGTDVALIRLARRLAAAAAAAGGAE